MDTTDLLTQLPEFHPLFEGLESFELFFFAEKSHLISPNGCKYFNTSKENDFFFLSMAPVQNYKWTKLFLN